MHSEGSRVAREYGRIALTLVLVLAFTLVLLATTAVNTATTATTRTTTLQTDSRPGTRSHLL